MMQPRKKVLFFSCEPGGAEVLIPVVRILQSRLQYDVEVWSYGHALERFARKQIVYRTISPIRLDDSSAIHCSNPSLLITSATSLSEGDLSDRYLWVQSRQLGIPSLAFLDQWQNYVARFRGKCESDLHYFMPDRVNCLNGIGRSEMIQAGFDESRLVELGHPYLSSLADDLARLNVDLLRSRLNLGPQDNVALFISEPIHEYYGQTRGYDQYQVLDYFLETISCQNAPLRVLVKLHPKDDGQKFKKITEKYKVLRPIFICNELQPIECLAIADHVYGMSSIMLIEAYVLGKKVLSLQPGLCVEDPMVLSRHNLIPVVLDYGKRDLSTLAELPSGSFDYQFDQQRFIQMISTMTDLEADQ